MAGSFRVECKRNNGDLHVIPEGNLLPADGLIVGGKRAVKIAPEGSTIAVDTRDRHSCKCGGRCEICRCRSAGEEDQGPVQSFQHEE